MRKQGQVDSRLALLSGAGEGSEDDETALIAAAQRDPAAFGVLYQRHVTQIYSYLCTRAGEDEAADLTQHVFLKALDGLPRYRNRGVPFTAWLFRIARNALTDSHRRRKPTVAWDLLPEAMQPAIDDDLAADTIQQERITVLRQLVTGLGAEKRELLALRFAGGLTIREIAAILGRSEGAVKMELRRTLGTLKERYDAD